MFNIQNEVVRSMHAASENMICISSNAIDAFARSIGFEECARDRESLNQPTLVELRAEHSEWFYFMRLLCWTTQRAVIAVNQDWLEAYWGGGKQARPADGDYLRNDRRRVIWDRGSAASQPERQRPAVLNGFENSICALLRRNIRLGNRRNPNNSACQPVGFQSMLAC